MDGPLELAQITTGVTLSYQDWRELLDDFRPGRPKLAAWYAAFAERPAMRETEPQETPER